MTSPLTVSTFPDKVYITRKFAIIPLVSLSIIDIIARGFMKYITSNEVRTVCVEALAQLGCRFPEAASTKGCLA
jgi:hypothetical protein